ncbi:hypothetical protein STEG23_036375, partial [Scotinomys teguina]
LLQPCVFYTSMSVVLLPERARKFASDSSKDCVACYRKKECLDSNDHEINFDKLLMEPEENVCQCESVPEYEGT